MNTILVQLLAAIGIFIISVICIHEFDAEINSIVPSALISMVISLTIHVLFRLTNNNGEIKALKEEVSDLKKHLYYVTGTLTEAVEIGKIIHKIRKIEDLPGIKERRRHLIGNLRELSDGNIALSARWEVYNEDIRCIRMLESGSYCATVPIIQKYIKTQFSDRDFKDYLYEQVRAVDRGIEVNRLYLFDNPEQMNLHEVKSHLQRASKGGINIRYVIGTEIPSDRRKQFLSTDIVLFDRLRVSTGRPLEDRLDHMETVYSSNVKDIDSKWKLWNRLWTSELSYSYDHTMD